jgi:hypothetical protein
LNPKEVVASRRKSPAPGEYDIPSSITTRNRPKHLQTFDSKEQRFKNSPFDIPSKTTKVSVGPGSYQTDFDQILE